MQKVKSPQYRNSPRMVPPHMPQFTVTCSIGRFEVEAFANSNKKAKHNVALKIEKPSISVDESVRRAKSLYPGLENYSGMQRTPIMTEPNATLSDSHLILESSDEPLVRLAAVELINENPGKMPGLHETSNKEETLDDVTSLLGLSIEYDILSNTPDHAHHSSMQIEPRARDNERGHWEHVFGRKRSSDR